MQTGALIVAAGMSSRMNSFKPMLKIGSISLVHRIILTFEQAGIGPIVLITGHQAELLEKHVAPKNVICIRNDEYEHSEMFDSVKIGLNYLEDKCDQIIFVPVDIPLFTKNTVEKLINCNAKLASPTCNGRKGHPLLIHTTIVPSIVKYQGNQGLRGAIDEVNSEKLLVEVEDKGILFDVDSKKDFHELLKWHNSQNFHPQMQLCLVKELTFFRSSEALLLRLIHYTNSVRYACQQMNISYSKGWNMINLMEGQLGYAVVIRRPGGANGGYTSLTEEGRLFLEKYTRFETEAKDAVQVIFEKCFF